MLRTGHGRDDNGDDNGFVVRRDFTPRTSSAIIGHSFTDTTIAMFDNLSVKNFAHSQLCLTLPYPEAKFTGKTIIVTGANSGLGLEAARHFVRLDAARVILAVRSKAKGEAAMKSISESTDRPGIAEVWELDLASYASVERFAAKVNNDLDCVDVVAQNAGVMTFKPISKVANDEYHITINVVSTFLLAMLLLPTLRKTASITGTHTVMTFTSSWTHTMVSNFPEQNAKDILAALSDYKDGQKVANRYETSKLVQLLLINEMADQATKAANGDSKVIISAINPGAVTTNITRDSGVLLQTMTRVGQKLTCRPTEEGSRTLVHAAYGGPETHGEYLDDCQIGETSHFVTSEKGHAVQEKLWHELSQKLQGIHPGIMSKI